MGFIKFFKGLVIHIEGIPTNLEIKNLFFPFAIDKKLFNIIDVINKAMFCVF